MDQFFVRKEKKKKKNVKKLRNKHKIGKEWGETDSHVDILRSDQA